MEKFLTSTQLWIEHNFRRILHHKSSLFPCRKIPAQLPESPYQGYGVREVGCVQTLTSELCSEHRPRVHPHWSSLPANVTLRFFIFSPQLKPELYNFKSPSVFLPLQDSELLCSIKTVLHLFPSSQQCCPLGCRKGFDFSLSHCDIDSIFWFLFSWCFCGTFSWVYKIRMAICWNHWSKFGPCNYPIACAITRTMCTGKQSSFSWTSVGAFLHSNFENISSQMKLIFVDKALHHFSTNTISTCQSVSATQGHSTSPLLSQHFASF